VDAGHRLGDRDRVDAGEDVLDERPAPRARLLSAERFRALMASAPRPDDAFAADVQAARDSVGAPGEPWPS
jgi:hypothetical protein